MALMQVRKDTNTSFWMTCVMQIQNNVIAHSVIEFEILII